MSNLEQVYVGLIYTNTIFSGQNLSGLDLNFEKTIC